MSKMDIYSQYISRQQHLSENSLVSGQKLISEREVLINRLMAEGFTSKQIDNLLNNYFQLNELDFLFRRPRGTDRQSLANPGSNAGSVQGLGTGGDKTSVDRPSAPADGQKIADAMASNEKNVANRTDVSAMPNDFTSTNKSNKSGSGSGTRPPGSGSRPPGSGSRTQDSVGSGSRPGGQKPPAGSGSGPAVNSKLHLTRRGEEHAAKKEKEENKDKWKQDVFASK